jgi:hypothetical protein
MVLKVLTATFSNLRYVLMVGISVEETKEKSHTLEETRTDYFKWDNGQVRYILDQHALLDLLL